MIANLEKHLSRRVKRLSVSASMLIACVVGFGLWAWWTSFNTPHIYPRPHPIMWDIVSLDLRSQGLPVAPGTHNIDENVFVHIALWTMSNFGGDYRAIAAAQLPFLFLLLTTSHTISKATMTRRPVQRSKKSRRQTDNCSNSVAANGGGAHRRVGRLGHHEVYQHRPTDRQRRQ